MCGRDRYDSSSGREIDGLTAGVIASMDTMSRYTVYALGSSERVVLFDARRILDMS